MQLIRGSVDWGAVDLFGFGASLMLATLDYHLDGCISELEWIFDDDEARHQTSYCNVDVSVQSTKLLPPPETGTYVITSFENARTIYSRLRDVGAARIVAPAIS
ncbi:MAG: hypothetical protein GKR86_14695 [Ilumatobacter sp.]|nr:hypothetical protein [Ilumatobacter sp.]